MMRILYWTERFFPYVGGIETLSNALIPALAQRGHEFEVVTSHSAADLPDEDFFANVPVHRLHFLTALAGGDLRKLLAARQRLEQIKQRFRPHLVHIHFSGPSSLFHWRTTACHPCPTLVSLHSIPPAPKNEKSLFAATLEQSDWVTSVSAHMLQVAHKLAPNTKQRSTIIYNGITLPSLAPTRLPYDLPVLLCVGRLVDWKRFDWAIALFAALHATRPEVRLVLVGDGQARNALHDQVARLGLQSAVTFTGILDASEVQAQLNRSTLLLLPSTATENLPMVALEAGAMARPLLASHVSGLPEIIEDGDNGYLVPADDADAWLNRINYLLDHPVQAQQMGNRARTVIENKFALSHCVAAYAQLYDKLVRQPQT